MENYDTTQDERLWGMLAYLLTFVGGFMAPLVIYAVKKDRSRFLAFHALQSLYLDVGFFVLIVVGQSLRHFPPPILSIAWAAVFVFNILAAIKAYDGEWYQIPIIGGWAMRQASPPGSGGAGEGGDDGLV